MKSKIIVAVLQMVHVMELKKTADNRYEITGGMEGLFLKELLTLLGMEYELVIPPDGEYGRIGPNKTWSGLIGMAQKGDADLALSGLAILEERRLAVDFSVPYLISVQTFALKQAPVYHLKNAYLYPFSRNVWMCFFCTLITSTVALWLIFDRKYSMGRIVFELCGIVMRQPFMLGGNSWKSKFLLAICVWYALVLTTCYSGILLSFMTIPIEGETVKTVRQLSEAIARGTHKCYVIRGTITVFYLLWTKVPHLKYLGKTIHKNKWYLESFDSKSLAKIGFNDAIISSKIFLDIVYPESGKQKSKYLISNDALSTSLVGIAINHNFCCRKKMNKIISRMLETGIREKVYRETAFKYWLSTYKTEEKAEAKEYRISVEDISGALLILGAGYAISFIVLIAEIIFSKYLKKFHQL